MQKQMTNFWFRLMALEYRLKSDAAAVHGALKDAGIQPGMSVLDFGCGLGRYSLPAARIVGKEGVVYAVDLHRWRSRSLTKPQKRRGNQLPHYPLRLRNRSSIRFRRHCASLRYASQRGG